MSEFAVLFYVSMALSHTTILLSLKLFCFFWHKNQIITMRFYINYKFKTILNNKK